MSAPAHAVARANRILLRKLALVAALMFGFGFALVPFYEKICQVTGVRNLLRPDPVAVVNTQVDRARVVTVEFDANTQRLAWTFKPIEGHRAVHPGELTQVVYEVHNTLDRPVTGQAIPSYGPQFAAQYVKKLECFCFQSQTLAPGETRRLPVVFVLDPALPADVGTVTFSYTFFEVAGRDGKPG